MKPLEKVLCAVIGLAVVLLLRLGLSASPPSPPPPTPAPIRIPVVERVKVLETLPHDSSVFVQGLEFHEGFLYETGGLYGQSLLRKLNVSTGKVTKQVSIDPRYFAEGLTIFHNQIYVLTWREHVVLLYDMELREIGQFYLPTEGWGLTHDDANLIYSDGSNKLYFVSPTTFEVRRKFVVKERTKAGTDTTITFLNELEYHENFIYANIWMAKDFVIIDPSTGYVVKRLKCSIIADRAKLAGGEVLNGIAYDSETDEMYITGKMWPTIHRIQKPTI